MKPAGWSLAALIVAGLAVRGPDAPVRAQDTTPVRWTLAASARKGLPVPRGAAVTARLHAALAPGWHIYSLLQEPGGPTAMRISLPPHEPFVISGDLDAPPPRSAIDPGFDRVTHFYTSNVEFRIPLRATRKASTPVAVDVFYQACTREMCLPPASAHLNAAVLKAQENPR